MESGISFFARVGLAFKLLFQGGFARQTVAGLAALEAQRVKPPPERAHASGLLLLAALQREGRLVDFLEQEVASFSDEEIGSAARVVHAGCRKALRQYFDFEPAVCGAEGADFQVPKDFDAQRIRLTGNVAGPPPYRGALKHHGWVAAGIRMPDLSAVIDPRVIAPAEVEI